MLASEGCPCSSAETQYKAHSGWHLYPGSENLGGGVTSLPHDGQRRSPVAVLCDGIC